MRRLDEPPVDAERVYNELLSTRHTATRKRLQNAGELVLECYQRYLDAAGDVTGLTPMTAPSSTRAVLRTNYTHFKESGHPARAAILQANPGGVCPSCGHRTAATLDHYLPRSHFPEFSVFPLNLVPACYECNQIKETNYRDNGVAIYLHAYFDYVSERHQFLFAKVDVIDGVITARFYVRPPDSVDAVLQERIKTHFKRLELAKLYVLIGANEMGERLGALRSLKRPRAQPDAIARYLVQEATSIARSRGPNYWKFALLAGMWENEDVRHGEFI